MKNDNENDVSNDDAELEEKEIVVNEPGDCIGHWAECEECKMCEIEESCMEMTKNINGDDNAEKEK